MREDRRDELRQIVGDHHFLEQAGGEDRQPARRQHCRASGAAALELRDHLGVMHQRAGDQMREEGHEQRVADDVALDLGAAHHVDQIGDLLEGEEGDAERQHDVDERQRRAGQRSQAVEDEIGVFEIAQHREIERDAERAGGAAAQRILHPQAQPEIHRH